MQTKSEKDSTWNLGFVRCNQHQRKTVEEKIVNLQKKININYQNLSSEKSNEKKYIHLRVPKRKERKNRVRNCL